MTATALDVRDQVIDGETGELVPVSPRELQNLFGTTNPRESLMRAKEHADVLAAVIKERKLFKVIGDKAHVYVDAWALLGSRLGVFAVCEDVVPIEIEGVPGFKATVKAVTRQGDEVGRAVAYCMRDEKTWKGRDIHALAGMAETRATSRALRKPLGFIVQLAGYAPTAAEEMPSDDGSARSSEPKKASKAQHSKLGAVVGELEAKHPSERDIDSWEQLTKQYAQTHFGARSRAQLSTSQMAQLIDEAEGWLASGERPAPF